MNYGKEYRDCIKRNGDKTPKQSTCYIVTSCHGNNDEMWSTSCLIMQHKPYIVEQPPPHSSKATITTQTYASMYAFIFSAWAVASGIFQSINIVLFHSVSVPHVASMVGRCDCIHWEESRQVCWNTLQSRCMSAKLRDRSQG